jgi:hypothetical protein
MPFLAICGALAYLLKSEKGATKAIWDDILIIGLIMDFLIVLATLGISMVPLGSSLTASLLAKTTAMPTFPIWGILIELVLGYVEYLIGAIIVPIIKWLSEIL